MLLENAYYTGNIVLPLNTRLTPTTGGISTVLVDGKQFELQYMNVVVSALSRDPVGVRAGVRACLRACVRAWMREANGDVPIVAKIVVCDFDNYHCRVYILTLGKEFLSQ